MRARIFDLRDGGGSGIQIAFGCASAQLLLDVALTCGFACAERFFVGRRRKAQVRIKDLPLEQVTGNVGHFPVCALAGSMQRDLSGLGIGDARARLLRDALSRRDRRDDLGADSGEAATGRMFKTMLQSAQPAQLALSSGQRCGVAAYRGSVAQYVDLRFQRRLCSVDLLKQFGAEASLRLDGKCPSSIGGNICRIECDKDLSLP